MYPLESLGLLEWMSSLALDFFIGFTFFTALTYAVLGRRFGAHRPAAAMSVAVGLALAVGLIWWEQATGWTIRSLGPVAVGLAILALGAVVFQSLKQIGGSIAGGAIALSACLLIGSLLGLPWPVGGGLILSFILLSLLAGLTAFALHNSQAGRAGSSVQPSVGLGDSHVDVSDLLGSRDASASVEEELEHLQRSSAELGRGDGSDQRFRQRLQRLLLVEGALTQRLAALRAKACRVRKGEAHRIDQLSKDVARLPPAQRKQANQRIRELYREAEIQKRIDRLDAAVAATEKRVRRLTFQANEALDTHRYDRVPQLLAEAIKLQKHNSRLIERIEATEAKMLASAKNAMRQLNTPSSR